MQRENNETPGQAGITHPAQAPGDPQAAAVPSVGLQTLLELLTA
jgi:hypothetical protein